MPIRIVTDSTADISTEIVEKLGITVVPVYVRFGNDVFRDGVDICQDAVYQRMLAENSIPTTSQPTPADFSNTYSELLKAEGDIVSIHLSCKLSGTYNSAQTGRDLTTAKNRVTVLDSMSLSMGLGLSVITAARLAQAGANLESIINSVKETPSVTRIVAVFDTLKYVLRSGRLGAAKALIGGILNVKPMITLRDGTFWPVGIARTRSKALDSLVEMVKKSSHIEDIAIVYATTLDEALSLKKQLSSYVDAGRLYVSCLGPALGAHGGPGTIIVALRQRMLPATV
ncbi:DegV family protein [Dehalogenimonas sp. WBC-2]|nr:DegV family protein [Dehalogenimonas sp. WBC-2]